MPQTLRFLPASMPAPSIAPDALAHAVRAAFAAHGTLAVALPGFCAREGQQRLAHAVAYTIAQGGQLAAEAATGVGKTFAYLAPALLSGERAIISTATKALQEQLFRRDLPTLARALALPLDCKLLKGRASYLCRYRLELAATSGETPRRHLRQLAELQRWARRTTEGDLGEVPGLDERAPIIPLISSTRENCLGSECPHYEDCFVYRARRAAMSADVLVINHHLFFADLVIRESGMAELLPSARVVIFDEAHQLNACGIQFLGQRLSSHQVLDFARDTLAVGLSLAGGLQPWQELAGEVQQSARDLRLVAGRAQGRLAWHGAAPDGLDAAAWNGALARLGSALAAAREALMQCSELAPDFPRLVARAEALVALAQHFGAPGDGAQAPLVRWLDVDTRTLHLVESPLDIAHAVRTRMLGLRDEKDENAAPEDAPQGDCERQRAWVFVSATLGEDEKLSWFTESCGLQSAATLRVGSPFDYARQAALHVPAAFPAPGSPQHSASVAQLAAHCATRLGGRILVLTTTLRALRAVSEQLRGHFAQSGAPIDVLVQGEQPKHLLMERFRAGGGSVLVGSASFWEGVDIPGDALQCLIIDKLPFPPPDDPLVAARSRRLEDQGRSAFAHYSLPEAAIALKQGAGRLIRRESDRGLLIICDARLRHKGYGRRLLNALPPMQRIGDDALDAVLGALALTQ